MPYIGFQGFIGGVWEANVTHLALAIYPLNRAYSIWGSGEGAAVGIGAVRSTEHLGSFIPDIDDEGRRFPNRLSGNSLVFEVSAGVSLQSPHRVKIKFQSMHGSQSTIYEWEGRIPLNSSAVAGFTVDGTIRRAHSGNEKALVSYLLWTGEDDAIIQRLRSRAAAQRQHAF
jgi:hypothetical protein